MERAHHHGIGRKLLPVKTLGRSSSCVGRLWWSLFRSNLQEKLASILSFDTTLHTQASYSQRTPVAASMSSLHTAGRVDLGCPWSTLFLLADAVMQVAEKEEDGGSVASSTSSSATTVSAMNSRSSSTSNVEHEYVEMMSSEEQEEDDEVKEVDSSKLQRSDASVGRWMTMRSTNFRRH